MRPRAFALGVVLATAAACTHSPAPVSLVRWESTSCPPDVAAAAVEGVAVNCGYVEVPERHTDADGTTIRIFVARFRPGGNVPAEPVVILGGIDLGAPVHYADDIAVLIGRVRREVVVIEPRGTGHGLPSLTCPEMDAVDDQFVGASLLEPRLADALAGAVSACRERLGAEGVDPSAYDVAESAADVADVRRALHLDDVIVGTYGYNSRIAFEVIRSTPSWVRAVWMDSPIYPEQSVFDIAITGTRNALAALDDACAAQRSCSSSIPSVGAAFDRVVADAQAHPTIRTVEGGSTPATIDGPTVSRALRDFLSFAPTAVPAVLARLRAGNADDVAQYEISTRPTCFGYQPVCTPSAEPAAMGILLSFLCLHEASLTSPAALSAESLDSALDAAYAPNPWLDLCAGWSVDTPSPTNGTPVVSDVPVLLLHGRFDPYTTPPDPGWLVGLSHAYAFEFPTQSYTPVREGDSECAASIRNAFVEDPTSPPESACIDTMPEPALNA